MGIRCRCPPRAKHDGVKERNEERERKSLYAFCTGYHICEVSSPGSRLIKMGSGFRQQHSLCPRRGNAAYRPTTVPSTSKGVSSALAGIKGPAPTSASLLLSRTCLLIQQGELCVQSQCLLWQLLNSTTDNPRQSPAPSPPPQKPVLAPPAPPTTKITKRAAEKPQKE